MAQARQGCDGAPPRLAAEQFAEAGFRRGRGGERPLLPEQGPAQRRDTQAATPSGKEKEKGEIGAERRGKSGGDGDLDGHRWRRPGLAGARTLAGARGSANWPAIAPKFCLA